MNLTMTAHSTIHAVAFAIADDGSLWRRYEGDWTLFDFNKIYEGYYPKCDFTALAVFSGGYLLAGVDHYGFTRVYESMLGEVWKPALADTVLSDEGEISAKGGIRAICECNKTKQAFLFGDGGMAITLSGCRKCSYYREIAKKDIIAAKILPSETEILIKLSDETIITVSIEKLLQYKVSTEYAMMLISNGAQLIDVRPSPFFNAEHAQDSINVPLNNLDQFLKNNDGKNEYVFVCDYGPKAAYAAKRATEAGFYRVCHAGSYKNFIYY